MTKQPYIKPQLEELYIPPTLNLLGTISGSGGSDTGVDPIDFGSSSLDPIDFDQGADAEA